MTAPHSHHHSRVRVSVIVPNFNYARFLKQRLQSILQQSYREIEVIYVDDGSTDESDRIFSAFRADPRVRGDIVHANGRNGGNPFKQWNRGARLARGDYIWIAEADDYADPQFLERLVPILDVNPNVGLAYCQSLAVDEAGTVLHSLARRTRELDSEHWDKDFITSGEWECRRHLILKNTIPNASAVLMRRKVFEAAGCADETLRCAGDWMTWVRMLLISDLAFVAQPLNFFRRHARSVRCDTEKRGLPTLEAYRVQDEIRSRLALTEDESERAFDYILKKWRNRAFRLRNRISGRASLKIYRLARETDPVLGARIRGELLWLLTRGLL